MSFLVTDFYRLEAKRGQSILGANNTVSESFRLVTKRSAGGLSSVHTEGRNIPTAKSNVIKISIYIYALLIIQYPKLAGTGTEAGTETATRTVAGSREQRPVCDPLVH